MWDDFNNENEEEGGLDPMLRLIQALERERGRPMNA